MLSSVLLLEGSYDEGLKSTEVGPVIVFLHSIYKAMSSD